VTARPIIVLGMHRSGTSCLAGSLQQRGLFLGEVYESRPYNRKGNRENQRIMDLNDAVLDASGGAWDRPPQALRWDAAAAAERDAIVASLVAGAEGRAWGFKDPRTLLTLAFWLDGVADARFVGAIRNPVQVVRSLTARDPSMAVDAALDLWLDYNQRLLALLGKTPFPVLDFDMAADEYPVAVDALARQLHLPVAASGSAEFFDDALRTPAGAEEIRVPAAHAATHAALLDAARTWQQ
jgi:hypothetical protein